MAIKFRRVVLIGLMAIAAPAAFIFRGFASDHADTPNIAANPGEDISDVFMFPSATNPNNVVLVMNVHPLIGPGQGLSTYFDPNVLYQFKIDNTGDGVEDLVIQARFGTPGSNQTVAIVGPVRPTTSGSTNIAEKETPLKGTYNTTITSPSGMKVFCGPREDPFFFDLDQFFTIFPDRATPINGVPVSNPNVPQATSWRPAPGPGVTNPAQDFLSVHQFNVLSIIVELPKSMLLK